MGAGGIYHAARAAKMNGWLFAVPSAFIANMYSTTLSVPGACLVTYGAAVLLIALIAKIRGIEIKP